MLILVGRGLVASDSHFCSRFVLINVSLCLVVPVERVEPQNQKTCLCAQQKIQTSLRIRAFWSESSFGAFWIVKYAKFLHAHNEDFDHGVDREEML